MFRFDFSPYSAPFSGHVTSTKCWQWSRDAFIPIYVNAILHLHQYCIYINRNKSMPTSLSALCRSHLTGEGSGVGRRVEPKHHPNAYPGTGSGTLFTHHTSCFTWIARIYSACADENIKLKVARENTNVMNFIPDWFAQDFKSQSHQLLLIYKS